MLKMHFLPVLLLVLELMLAGFNTKPTNLTANEFLTACDVGEDPFFVVKCSKLESIDYRHRLCTMAHFEAEQCNNLTFTYRMICCVLLQKFATIETWYGLLFIMNTDFQDLAFLRSLVTIRTSFSNYAFDEENSNKAANLSVLYIYSNANLTSLGLPNLKLVSADVLPVTRRAYGLFIEMNRQLCMSESEFWKLRKLERAFMYDVKVCGPVTKQYCSSSAFLYSNTPLGCQILLNGIWLRDVTNTSYQDHLNQAYSTVEEVHGPIVIFRTDFTNLSFPALHTIRSQYYDGHNDWQWQIIIIRGNYYLKAIDFPKLVNWTHYGKEPQLTNSANYEWRYTQANCDLFLKIPYFSIKDPYATCGLVPIINNGKWTAWVVIQIGEKVVAIVINLLLCLYLTYKLFKSKITVNFFHFATVFLVLITIVECLYVSADFVHDNRYLYIVFPLNWLTLLLTIISAFLVHRAFMKYHPDDIDLISQHNKSSVGFFLQAFLAFIFCGYSDGLNQFIRYNTKYIWFVHYWDSLFYWYGGLAMRWHYTPIIIVMIKYVEDTFAKLPARSNNVSNRSSTIAFVN
uniref:G_PROTEIN_RECEP_F3_4 domain-containing protein n=1 Tax=Caenorhabditis tropicalis TaxID=1561998 RepID=A0A1I7TW60_9PELO